MSSLRTINPVIFSLSHWEQSAHHPGLHWSKMSSYIIKRLSIVTNNRGFIYNNRKFFTKEQLHHKGLRRRARRIISCSDDGTKFSFKHQFKKRVALRYTW